MKEADQIRQLLFLLPQPAFLLDGQTILYCNPPALHIGLQDGQTMQTLLPELPEAGACVCSLQLGLNSYTATIRPLGAVRVCLLENLRSQEATDVKQKLSAQLRKPLGDLFLAADSVFPELSAASDKTLTNQLCRMERGLYQLQRLATQLSVSLQEQAGITIERVDLQSFFDSLLQKAQSLCATVSVHLQAQGLRAPVSGNIDKDKIEWAFWSLLSNAIRSSGSSASIRVCIEAGMGRLKLQFETDNDAQDTSVPAFLPNFENSVESELALVQNIAVQHRGSAIFCSNDRGGTTAIVWLPLGKATDIKSPVLELAITGGRSAALIALSDVLPAELYHPLEL